MIVCKECKQSKPVTGYYPDNHSRCRECIYLANKRWRRKATPEERRTWYLKAEYGITPEQYQVLYEVQRGRCRICKCRKELVVDHDHKTGRVRGLLCNGCNVGIGRLGDTAFVAYRAYLYLAGRL